MNNIELLECISDAIESVLADRKPEPDMMLRRAAELIKRDAK